MSKLSSGETAFEALVSSIRSGTYRPGDRLREEEVGARLNLSRTPVREALRRLEAEGIVEHRPRIGAVVRALSHAEIVELYEMRIVLERTAAEMAAKHGAQAEFDALDDINQAIESVREDPAQAAALNQDFHRGLYLAGRNRFLMDAARALNNALLLLGPTTFTDPERIDEVTRQHRAIVEALRSGDEKAAGAAAEAHLQTSLRHRIKALGA
ncbi:putative regulator PutR for proline utilization, GntR family [Candidatus Rhodobacter oscarellae]|uniref:Putative regulator PutR for proline utilization, GntR family n=1 Tax=Candidatus Rhodobacter oscarellae TaxID=1675527 RepID=A0A0J9E0W7_9RHOB|nr:GntR family transcriptional regulator [Candidatus Rhodobacter lobularis]KMW56317.1 putative regulator PutR for proline utilization, GntR family [Candidatus Rhodobacter lobularis]